MQSRIRLIREAYGISLEDFASKLGIHREWAFAAENALDSSDIPGEIISKISATYYLPDKFILGCSYKLKMPVTYWHQDQQEDYVNATAKMKPLLAAMFGYCEFTDTSTK